MMDAGGLLLYHLVSPASAPQQAAPSPMVFKGNKKNKVSGGNASPAMEGHSNGSPIMQALFNPPVVASPVTLPVLNYGNIAPGNNIATPAMSCPILKKLFTANPSTRVAV
jgi:hypothetical protein